MQESSNWLKKYEAERNQKEASWFKPQNTYETERKQNEIYGKKEGWTPHQGSNWVFGSFFQRRFQQDNQQIPQNNQQISHTNKKKNSQIKEDKPSQTWLGQLFINNFWNREWGAGWPKRLIEYLGGKATDMNSVILERKK